MIDPEEIAAQKFGVSVLGFDRAEVSEYLQAVARDVRRLIARFEQEYNGPRQEMQQLDAEKAFADVGRKTQHILQVAQETGERLIEEAREQGAHELERAREEQTRLLGEVQRKRDNIAAQLEQLQETKQHLVRQLYQASSSVEQVCTALEAEGPAESTFTAPERGEPEATDGSEGASTLDPDDAASGHTQPLRLVVNGEAQGGTISEPMASESMAPQSQGGVALAAEKTDDGDAQARRNRLLAPLRGSLVEALERGLDRLRDMQMDRIRRMGEDPDVDAVALAEAEFLSLGRLARESLSKAFALGAATASTMAGRQLPSASTEDPGTAQLVAESAERVAAPVRSVIEDALAAREPEWAIVDRLEQLFSSLGDELLEDLAAHHLISAFERGKLAAWMSGEIPARRWVLASEPECFEDRCSTNVHAGVVSIEEPFPSGDHAPPIHEGCTCTTVPALEESST